jgi:hypothetical protein
MAARVRRCLSATGRGNGWGNASVVSQTCAPTSSSAGFVNAWTRSGRLHRAELLHVLMTAH